MMRSMYSAVSGLKTHQTKMDVIGNNIANVNTVAFKSSSVTFRDILYQTTSGASGANVATGVGGVNAKQIGLGVSMAATSVSIETAGASETTGNPFDIKLTDKNSTNFFVVNDGTQNLFTRAGSFYVDGAGNLCMTSTGYTVMGWQVDPTTDEIRKDTVSALRIMQEANLTSAPEATVNATMSGVLDENDADVKSEAGKTMNLNFYDDLGYQYTAKFAVKSTGVDGEYRVSLSSLLDSNNVDLLAGKTAEEISELFGAAKEVVDTVQELTIKDLKTTITLNADGTISDGTNTYALNAAGTAFEYTDAATNATASYSVAEIFGETVAQEIANGKKLSFDAASGSYGLSDVTKTDYAVDAAYTLNEDGTISDGTYTYALNAAKTQFECTDTTVTPAPAAITIETVFGTGITAEIAAGGTLDFADGKYSVTTTGTPTAVTPVTEIAAQATADGNLKIGAYTYTLSEDGKSFVSAEVGATPASYTIEEIFNEDVSILDGENAENLSIAYTEGKFVIGETSIEVDKEVAKAFTDADLQEGYTLADDGTITDKTGVSYTYNAETGMFESAAGQTKMINEVFNITETMQDYLGIGVNGTTKKNSDYAFTFEDGQYTITKKVPSYILKFNTANGVFESINNDPKAVTLKLGDATGEGKVNKNGNFQNISIDFTQCLNYNNGGKSTIGMDSGATDGTTGKGRKLGNMIGVSIDTSGKIFGSYDNGNTELLGQIAVAQFSNASGLEKVGESCYQTTLNSGEFDGIGVEVSADGSSMTTGELEMSNVDLSTEFTQMITTQRGFQANSRVITTSDTLLEELVNLKR